MFDLYKPFRNRLRQQSLLGSLFTVFQFMQFLDFDIPLPASLGAPPLTSVRDRFRMGMVQWEFEILAREIILNSDIYAKRSLSTWSDIAREINSIKKLENEVYKLYSKEDDILHEIIRISHRQFPWQKGITQPHLSRYSRLYEDERLSEMIQSEYGMSHKEILQLSIGLSGHFLKNFGVSLPLYNEINRVSPETTAAFLRKFGSNLPDLRTSYAENAAYGINWAYSFNPLRLRPLVFVSPQQIICPIPYFLLRRATNEIYYDLVRKPEFSKAWGPAIQNLIGEVARRADVRSRFEVFPEARYGTKSKPKDTVDWIVRDRTASLFVECKGARVTYRGISDLTSTTFVENEFGRIKDFTVKLYKTLSSALSGEYPQWKPDGRPVYPIIVTLEDWQTFGIHVETLVLSPLKKSLNELGIDPSIVDRHPPSFCAVETFEMAMHVCNSVGIDTVFHQKNKGEYPQWALDTFLANYFADVIEDAEPLFSEQWDRILDVSGRLRAKAL